MPLSQPIYKLKQQAKILQKSKSIKRVNALNLIAENEGYNSWSHLAANNNLENISSLKNILRSFNYGDFVLIASRPGMSKTSFCLKLLVEAIKLKKQSCFYSLESSHKSIAQKLAQINESIGQNNEYLSFDFSNDISAKYIIEQSNNGKQDFKYIAIDYLQLLDQQRSKPRINIQLNDLKKFSIKDKKIVIFISQIDRCFEDKDYVFPKLSDLRLPNPVNVQLFNKIFFLHNNSLKMMKPKELIIKYL